MLNTYKYSRLEIVHKIKLEAQKTADGIYWYPYFNNIAFDKVGLQSDDDRLINRMLFINKVFFTQQDFEYFLACVGQEQEFDEEYIERMQRLNNEFLEKNNEVIVLSIKDKVKPFSFTLEELLDCYIYFKVYKNK